MRVFLAVCLASFVAGCASQGKNAALERGNIEHSRLMAAAGPTAWAHPSRKLSLHLGGRIGEFSERTASYYRVSASPKARAKRGTARDSVVESILEREEYLTGRRKLIEPDVFFSESGNTVLIEEDVSDASPHHQHVLVYFDGKRDQVRKLKLPEIPTQTYPMRSYVVSIDDDSVQFHVGGERVQTRKLAEFLD